MPVGQGKKIIIVPKIVFLYTTNGPQLANFGSGTHNLDSDLGVNLDSGIFIVGKLGRCGIGFPSDLVRDQLDRVGKLTTDHLNKCAIGVGGRCSQVWTQISEAGQLHRRSHAG